HHSGNSCKKPDDACNWTDLFMLFKISFKSKAQRNDTKNGPSCRKKYMENQKNRIINFNAIRPAKAGISNKYCPRYVNDQERQCAYRRSHHCFLVFFFFPFDNQPPTYSY